MSTNGLLPGLGHRTPEIGRLRLGDKGPSGAPRRLASGTWRLTSASRTILDAAAAIYGGTVTAWDGAPDEGFYQLTTAVSELDILIPGAEGAVTQAYEWWRGGTCERRCDGSLERIAGVTCHRYDPGQDAKLDQCAECEIITRFSVILPRVPGLGVWRLDTGGWMAATTLPSTLALLARMTKGEWIPAVLRAEQRSKKVRQPDGKVLVTRFVVPVLDLPGATIGQLVEGSGLVDAPALLEAVAPVTAREHAMARAAAVTVAPEPAGAPETPAGVVEAPPVRCEATSPYEGAERCRREAGHEGTHKASTKETWL